MTQRVRDSADEPENKPEKIEAELDETRQAISEDLRAIGEKLSPEHLKAQAKEALVEAKEAASEKLHEMTDSAKEKLIEAKDAAIDTVSETADEAWQQARRVTGASARFVRSNAVPLALVGIGVAWLVQANRRNGRDGWRAPSRRGMRAGMVETERGNGNGHSKFQDKLTDVKRRVADGASELGHRAEELGHRAEGALGRATHAVGEAGEHARDAAGRELDRVRRASTDFARENPLALGVAALAAGVGIGMLLPATERENEMLGARRDHLIEGARSTVENVERVAKDTVHGVGESLSEMVGQ